MLKERLAVYLAQLPEKAREEYKDVLEPEGKDGEEDAREPLMDMGRVGLCRCVFRCFMARNCLCGAVRKIFCSCCK